MKSCKKCLKDQVDLEFFRDGKYISSCRTCRNSRRRANRAADPEKLRAYERQRYLNMSPEDRSRHLKARDLRRTMLYRARQSAKKKGFVCTIGVEDIHIPETCPVLGIKLSTDGRRTPVTPSLDRVDNTQGYIPGNVAVISWKANDMKSNATIKDLKAMLRYMEGYFIT